MSISTFTGVMMAVLSSWALYMVVSYTPLTKEEHVRRFQSLDHDVEPFRRNLSECARQVRANMQDVDNFLKRVPQDTMQGKCFVACILRRNSIIKNNKIQMDTLIEANRQFYEDDSEVMVRLKKAGTECLKIVEGIFEICEYASMFNDCMHMKMEHILDRVTMERRMEALGQMSAEPDTWTDDEDELLQLVKDEL